MDTVNEPVEQNSGEMRQEIDFTRSAMADKLDALEDSVMGTVHSAQDMVTDSIQAAKDTVASVKRTFDIKHQVEQHPWAMLGGCALAGLALGSLFQRVRRPARQPANRLAGSETSLSGQPPLRAEQRGNGRSANDLPALHFQAVRLSPPGLFDRFEDEIEKVKGLAIGYFLGLARDSLKDSVPQLASQIDAVMNSVTKKLGGEPVQQHSS
jgi:ElaB/YqjD/DUF883 family membrane-anchored ribosome-binding protein